MLQELQFAKDKIDQAVAVLKAAGCNEHYEPLKHALKAQEALRNDIRGMITGDFPFVELRKESQSIYSGADL